MVRLWKNPLPHCRLQTAGVLTWQKEGKRVLWRSFIQAHFLFTRAPLSLPNYIPKVHLLIPSWDLHFQGMYELGKGINIQSTASGFLLFARKTSPNQLHQIWRVGLIIFFLCGRGGHKLVDNDHNFRQPIETAHIYSSGAEVYCLFSELL